MLPLGREAVRVKVLKFDSRLPVDVRKFSVDPQITSLDELRSIIVTAFELKEDFSLSYRFNDETGQEDYLAVFSDWDLDTAFMRAHNASCLSGSEPCIHLKVDVKPNSSLSHYKSSPVIEKKAMPPQSPSSHSTTAPIPVSESDPRQLNDFKQIQMGFQGMFMNHMEKTLNLVSRAFNLSDDLDTPPRPPLSQTEFLSFLGPVGHVIHGTKLREVVYNGGVETSFRKVAWKHILNLYPDGMSGKERLDYMKKKSTEYYSLRDVWRDLYQRGQMTTELTFVTNMVRKDVLRTDRHHKFYSGSDDNQNITFLFNILTTYALNHPTVSYCQGMSDLASPLLVVMENEAHAYICLCALMSRLYPNFLLDGEAMTLKFAHLTESLQIYDPVFYNYLQSQQADDLLFCYRWLLLEMKREFAFEDALHMLEVLWSSLPSETRETELPLKEKEFSPGLFVDTSKPPPISPLIKTPRENAYAKLCAMRRQSSSYGLMSNVKNKTSYKRMNQSLDENIGKVNTVLQACKDFQSLDESTNSGENAPKKLFDRNNFSLPSSSSVDGDTKVNIKSESAEELQTILPEVNAKEGTPLEDNNAHPSNDAVFIWENPLHDNGHGFEKFEDFDAHKKKDSKPTKPNNSKFFSNMSQELENAKKNCENLLANNKRAANLQTLATTITNFQKKYEGQLSERIFNATLSEEHDCQQRSVAVFLPSAKVLGGGNPFLIFLSLTVLMQHRDYIMRNQMDYNELAMYFDKMVRKHNVHRVLNQARRLYATYLKENRNGVS